MGVTGCWKYRALRPAHHHDIAAEGENLRLEAGLAEGCGNFLWMQEMVALYMFGQILKGHAA